MKRVRLVLVAALLFQLGYVPWAAQETSRRGFMLEIGGSVNQILPVEGTLAGMRAGLRYLWQTGFELGLTAKLYGHLRGSWEGYRQIIISLAPLNRQVGQKNTVRFAMDIGFIYARNPKLRGTEAAPLLGGSLDICRDISEHERFFVGVSLHNLSRYERPARADLSFSLGVLIRLGGRGQSPIVKL